MKSEHIQLCDLQPQNLWKHFGEICKIPHPSGKEEKLANHIFNFAKNLGLEATIDSVGNVIVRKPATTGMEHLKGVILQAHMDMVPQKKSDLNHDFEKDPIAAYVDGDWVKAKGTTLGADNGIGVAAALAILENQNLKHGPLEALFTVDEEVGFTGATYLASNLLKGDILLNLDECEGCSTVIIGCAGGVFNDAIFEYQPEKVPVEDIALEIKISGLHGGHSGGDIHLGRANAIKLITRLLWEGNQIVDLRLAHIEGGSARNVISQEATALITLPAKQKNDFINFVSTFANEISNEFKKSDPSINIAATPADLPKEVIDLTTQHHFLKALYVLFSGVIKMSQDIPNLVETSTNVGMLYCKDQKIYIGTQPRSSVSSSLKEITNRFHILFSLAKAEVRDNRPYPAWKPNVDSEILKLAQKIYKTKFGSELIVSATHGGLECGMILEKYLHLDMLSMGPLIVDMHSTNERVDVESVQKFWDFLTAILENIPSKG